MNSNENDKDNSIKPKKPPIWVVDKEADRLVQKYSNPEGRKLYCKGLNRIAFSRLLELEGIAASGKQPGRLFTVLLSQELERTGNNNLYKPDIDGFRSRYGS
jgi:hypothetical protein